MLGKRIMVIGICGSGKSTLATIIGDRFKLPVIHLDQIYWLSGWVERDRDESILDVNNTVDADDWVVDGNNKSSMNIRFKQADTVVWLKFNRFVALYRVVKRLFKNYGKVGKGMLIGCPYKLDLDFLWYIFWTFPQHTVPLINNYQKQYSNVNWIILKSPREVKEFMKQIEEGKSK